MKKIAFLLFFVTTLVSFAATISGNQGQVSISGGSMDVTANGSTVTVNSGQTTTFGENQGPSAPRATTQQDINKIKNELSTGSDDKLMNIKYPTTLSKRFIEGLKKELQSKGIGKDRFVMGKKGSKKQFRVNQVDIEKIKDIYPPYYKIVAKYYKNKKKASKVPTITIKLAHLKKFHKALFIKYGG